MTLLLFLQGHYGILVEVANENDNRPKFQQETVEQLSVSEVNPTLTVSEKPAASVPKTTQYSGGGGIFLTGAQYYSKFSEHAGGPI